MNEINEIPEESTFGQSFAYSVWQPNTTITLTNVPWSNDYRDVVSWKYHNQMDGLIEYVKSNSGLSYTIEHTTVIKPGQPVRVNLPIGECYRYNFLYVHVPKMPVPFSTDTFGRQDDYFYFVTGVNYISPNTTELYLQLDVWSTFGWKVQFGQCYLERGHAAISNKNQFRNNGQDFLTVPEGFDLGTDYQVCANYRHSIMGWDSEPCVLVASTVKLTGDFGTVDNPKLTAATGSIAEGLPNGCDLYVCRTRTAYRSLMLTLAEYPWISQGIIGVYLIPSLPNKFFNGKPKLSLSEGSEGFYAADGAFSVVMETITLKDGWKEDTELPQRYRYLKKFNTFPYTAIELTTQTGTPLVLKPELLDNHNKIEVFYLLHYVLPNMRIAVHPRQYNANERAKRDGWGWGPDRPIEDGGEALDMSTGFSNFPAFSITNNGYLSYMAANAHSIAYSHQAADWSQQRALAGNTLSYAQSSAGIDLANQLTQIGVQTANQSTALANQTAGYRAVVNGSNAVARGIIGGGPVGAALGVANAAADYAITTNQNTQQNAISNSSAVARTSASNTNAAYVRDTNKDYADWAAKGDYQNNIAAINAKCQDAKLIQPTTAGQIAGEAALYVWRQWCIVAKVKRINPGAMRAIGELWLRYGYAANFFLTPPSDLRCMTKFTYWKMKEAYLKPCQLPEQFKGTIRGIFEKGVTVWESPDYIGQIDYGDNEPLNNVEAVTA